MTTCTSGVVTTGKSGFGLSRSPPTTTTQRLAETQQAHSKGILGGSAALYAIRPVTYVAEASSAAGSLPAAAVHVPHNSAACISKVGISTDLRHEGGFQQAYVATTSIPPFRFPHGLGLEGMGVVVLGVQPFVGGSVAAPSTPNMTIMASAATLVTPTTGAATTQTATSPTTSFYSSNSADIPTSAVANLSSDDSSEAESCTGAPTIAHTSVRGATSPYSQVGGGCNVIARLLLLFS